MINKNGRLSNQRNYNSVGLDSAEQQGKTLSTSDIKQPTKWWRVLKPLSSDGARMTLILSPTHMKKQITTSVPKRSSRDYNLDDTGVIIGPGVIHHRQTGCHRGSRYKSDATPQLPQDPRVSLEDFLHVKKKNRLVASGAILGLSRTDKPLCAP